MSPAGAGDIQDAAPRISPGFLASRDQRASGACSVAQKIVYAITITAPENGTLETSVTNNIVAGTNVTVTATPAPGYELESITTNGTAITGSTFVMPAENVTVAATFKSAGPVYPPTWPDAQEYTAAFTAWAGNYDLTGVDLTTDAAKNAFLMNADPTKTVPELKITSITVADDQATIVVDAGTADLAEVNGVLYVESSNDLVNWTETQLALPTEIEGGDWTVTVDAGKFMKAKVGFEAPTK